MHVLNDVTGGEWLRPRLRGWGQVGSVAGAGFDAYARILHPIDGRQLDWSDHAGGMVPRVVDERRWTWAQVADAVDATMHPLVQFTRFGIEGHEVPDGWDLNPPETGALAAPLWAVLAGHLSRATETADDVTLGIWHGHGTLHDGGGVVMWAAEGATRRERREAVREAQEQYRRASRESISPDVARTLADGPLLKLPGREYLLLNGSIGELEDPDWGYAAGIGWREPRGHDPMPQLAWPADHAWVVASEIDWDSTIVAGSRDLINAVLGDPSFEAYEVSADSDLSWDGDTVNPAERPR